MRLLCSLFGHHRSVGRAKFNYDAQQWESACKHCGALMVRIERHKWRLRADLMNRSKRSQLSSRFSSFGFITATFRSRSFQRFSLSSAPSSRVACLNLSPCDTSGRLVEDVVFEGIFPLLLSTRALRCRRPLS